MSAYSILKVADLRIECGAHGLDYDGLRKQELIELLLSDDAQGEVEASEGNLDPGALESEDEEIVLGESVPRGRGRHRKPYAESRGWDRGIWVGDSSAVATGTRASPDHS